jgi:multiple sugar transport system permease protein
VPPTRARSLREYLFEKKVAYVLILPTLLAILLVNVYPLVYTFALSFEQYRISSAAAKWIGLTNYAAILADPNVLGSVRVSLIYTIGSVGVSFVLGFALALLLNQRLPWRGVIRSIFIIPWAVPAFVAALTWAWMYNDQFGIFSALFRAINIDPPNWLGANDALASVIAVAVWKNFPFHMIILLAGLQAIGADLYEAANVDGAGALDRFRHITLPLIRPMALIAILLNSINAFQDFTLPWLVAQGGPAGATTGIPIATYQIGFVSGDFGYAAAAAVLMFVFILAMSSVYVYAYIRDARSQG